MSFIEVVTIVIGSGLLTAVAIIKAQSEKSKVRVKVKAKK